MVIDSRQMGRKNVAKVCVLAAAADGPRVRVSPWIIRRIHKYVGILLVRNCMQYISLYLCVLRVCFVSMCLH